jgi:hypothetical protein
VPVPIGDLAANVVLVGGRRGDGAVGGRWTERAVAIATGGARAWTGDVAIIDVDVDVDPTTKTAAAARARRRAWVDVVVVVVIVPTIR